MERNVKRTYNCELSSKSFDKKSDLTVHIRIYTGEKPYKCEICSKSFSGKGSLNRHILIHSGEKPYKCELCSKAFTEKCKLTRHIRIHTDEKPYKCEVCSKAFADKGHRDVHKRIHTGEKPYKCESCSKAFAQKSHLNDHKRIHTGENPYKCELCYKAFTQKSNLNVHKLVHTGEKLYKCELCSKVFSVKGKLTEHIRIHTDEKPYKCELCSKTFAEKDKLTRHIRIHNGEKPYKCEVCSKAFAEKGHLDVHKRIHTDKNIYKCDISSRLFAEKVALNKHMRIHSGEKTYKCEFCSIVFTLEMTLIRHNRIHSGKKTHNISCSTSSEKETLETQPLSEDDSSSIQKVSTQGGKSKGNYKGEHLNNIHSILSQLSDYRMKHMLSPEEVFKDMKQWQLEHGAMAKRSMHPLKTENYPQFLSICDYDIRQFNAQISPNLVDSPLWITIQCFLSYIYKEDFSTTSCDNYPANQTPETENHLEKIDSVNNTYLKADNVQEENSFVLATNEIKRTDCENKGEDLVTETFSTNDDSLSPAGHLVITNVRSLQDFSLDSQSSCETEEEKGNLSLDTVGCSFESDVEFGTRLEESQFCLRESITETNMGSHDSSVITSSQPLFFKSEVILSDEEDSHDFK